MLVEVFPGAFNCVPVMQAAPWPIDWCRNGFGFGVAKQNKNASFLAAVYCDASSLTHFCTPFQHLLFERLMSLGMMGAPRVPTLNLSEMIVL